MLAYLSDRQWLWGAAGLYVAGVLLGTVSLLRGGRPPGTAIYVAILAGYVLQFIGLGLRGHSTGGCPLGNRFEIVQFTAGVGIPVYLGLGAAGRAIPRAAARSATGSKSSSSRRGRRSRSTWSSA